MKYDVTIGIPLYNVQDYIRRALDSALSQLYNSIEYLIVDDCSNDSSSKIVLDIKNSHPRGMHIRVITNRHNMGVSGARNIILDEAQGEYLYLMDSDDVIFENTISLLMNSIHEYDADIAFGSFEKISVAGTKKLYKYPKLFFSNDDEFAMFAYRKYGGIQASSCNYLVKTSILRNNALRFYKSDFWEDMVFTHDLVTCVRRVVLLPDITYSYRCRENSLSNFQQRYVIDKTEIMNNIKTIDYMKESSNRMMGKPYFPNRCYIAVMTDFYIACHILRHRWKIRPSIKNNEIKKAMHHPASLRQILSFRQFRMQNLCLYLIGVLPSPFSVTAIWFIGKVKKLI